MTTERHTAPVRWLALALVLGSGLTACSGDSAPTVPESDDLAPDVLAAMDEAIVDEYQAEAIYRQVIATFGEVAPFTNIVNAEIRHSTALAGLYLQRGLAVPADPWTAEDIPTFATVAEACRAGVTGEIENAAIYDAYLGLELPTDVRRVFESNRDASVERHLPAFESCS